MKFQNLARAAAGAALGLTLAFGTVAPALAASITIQNPVDNETYTAYKIFDVTNSGEAYNYYTNSVAVYNALNTYINFTHREGSNVWTATGLAEGKTAADLAQYLNGLTNLSTLFGEGHTASVDSEDGSLKVNDLVAGYYFVDSSLGSLCALETATDAATVEEKNSVPSISKGVREGTDGEYGETATIDIIDEIDYQLIVNTGTGFAGLGNGVDADYTIVDTLPDGVTFNAGSVSVSDWDSDDYQVTEPTVENGNTLTIVLKKDKLASLGQNVDITITYTARADEGFTLGSEGETNTVKLTYKNQVIEDSAIVKSYQIKGDAEGMKFTKVDGSTQAPLTGVKFILQREDGKYAKLDADSTLQQWVDTEKDATRLETDSAGHIYAYGLDAGDYTLTEVEALPGYNVLTESISVTIGEDGSVTYDIEGDGQDAGGNIIVENNTGSELPSTGGMGTTVLYVVGGALVVGTGITLVVRRRMSAEA